MTFSVCMRAVKPCVSSWCLSLDSETPGCLNANLVAAMGGKKDVARHLLGLTADVNSSLAAAEVIVLVLLWNFRQCWPQN